MKSLKTRLSVGLGSLALCMSLLFSMLLPVMTVQAEDSPTYTFYCSIYDTNYQIDLYGDDIDFVSLYTSMLTPEYLFSQSNSLLALSFKPFTYDKRQIDSNGKLDNPKSGSSESVSYTTKDSKTVTVFYAYIDAALTRKGSAETDWSKYHFFSGFPNFKLYRDDFTSSAQVSEFLNNEFLPLYLEEFVTNGGIDWEPKVPDESELEEFYLTGVSMSHDSEDGYDYYNIYWTGCTLDCDFSLLENVWVEAYVLSPGSSDLSNISGNLYSNGYLRFFLQPFMKRDDWDGKVYIQLSFDYAGIHYKSKYTVVNIKHNLIYDLGSDSGQTYTWNDFFLSNVKLTKDLVGYYKISWAGTTRSADLIYIPDSDTLVVAAIALEDSHGNTINQEVASTTIGKGYFYFDVEKLLDQDRESAYYWDGMIYLMPSFTKDGDLYMGQFTVVDVLSGGIYEDVVDEDNDIIHREPVNSEGSFDISSIYEYIKTGFSFLYELILMMKDFPDLVASIFRFLPQVYINALLAILLILFIGRVLGR